LHRHPCRVEEEISARLPRSLGISPTDQALYVIDNSDAAGCLASEA
jgi:hypothetical protein